MSQPRLGDLVEIKTENGFAYALYTHSVPKFGALLRVFDRIWPARPTSFNELVYDSVRFDVFIPLRAAIEEGIFHVISNLDIPVDLQAFPVFRTGMIDPRTKKVAVWWLWDGQREWRVGDLTPDERRLPIRGVWNDTMLVNRIESGWRPESDPR